jgi:hypothetical protein
METGQPDRALSLLECVECRIRSPSADGWRGVRVDLPDEDDEPLLAFYCPGCAERESGTECRAPASVGISEANAAAVLLEIAVHDGAGEFGEWIAPVGNAALRIRVEGWRLNGPMKLPAP